MPARGRELDLEKASLILLTDYRQGKLGRISLETPASRERMLDAEAARLLAKAEAARAEAAEAAAKKASRGPAPRPEADDASSDIESGDATGDGDG